MRARQEARRRKLPGASATLRAAVELSLDQLRSTASQLSFHDVERAGSAEVLWRSLLAEVLFDLFSSATRARGWNAAVLEQSRLCSLRYPQKKFQRLESPPVDHSTETLGAVHEALLGFQLGVQGEKLCVQASTTRNGTGSFFTPSMLAAQVVSRALQHQTESTPSVLDPALGAGVFLVEACRHLAERAAASAASEPLAARREIALTCLYGVDINPLSVAVTELCLWLLVGDPALPPSTLGHHLRPGDSLVGFDYAAEFPERADPGFDVVIGNPPWVAYAGRSAKPLDADRRAHYKKTFEAWAGFPTLHGLFIERAAQLAKQGTVALLVPSPIADLNGYRGVRRALTRSHAVRGDLLEFGQDAFGGVTQPCFALVADASPTAEPSDAPWKLEERSHGHEVAAKLHPPKVLERLLSLPKVDPEHFRERGFQSTRLATERLLRRGRGPEGDHTLPLLEGRGVKQFAVGAATVYLNADPQALQAAGCSLRPAEQYQAVEFVVRQTAAVPIAALHNGLAFRNSLLAGFGTKKMSAALLVALLNSSLYRALHVAAQRDARQNAFPQVKVGHLRALPRPPDNEGIRRSLEELTVSATGRGLTDDLRNDLDDRVFRLFDFSQSEARDVKAFVAPWQ